MEDGKAFGEVLTRRQARRLKAGFGNFFSISVEETHVTSVGDS
jgi:hypothetical protein